MPPPPHTHTLTQTLDTIPSCPFLPPCPPPPSCSACSLLLCNDPGLLWLRCAGLTAFQLALAHANLAMVDYLAPLMGRDQRQAAAALRHCMMDVGAPGPPAPVKYSLQLDLSDLDGNHGGGVEAVGGVVDKAAWAFTAEIEEENVAARVWESTSAAAAVVAAVAAASPVTVPFQDAEVASSYRLLSLALQQTELWTNDMSGLMRQVPLMDIRQVLRQGPRGCVCRWVGGGLWGVCAVNRSLLGRPLGEEGGRGPVCLLCVLYYFPYLGLYSSLLVFTRHTFFEICRCPGATEYCCAL